MDRGLIAAAGQIEPGDTAAPRARHVAARCRGLPEHAPTRRRRRGNLRAQRLSSANMLRSSQVAARFGALAPVLASACFYEPTGSQAVTTAELSTSDEASTMGSAGAESASTTTLEPTTLAPTTTQEPTAPLCGDGQLEPGEQCDDGNLVDGDGCELDCTRTPACGDGELAPGEQCDDGNVIDGDGCEQNCTKSILCGDGVLDPGEGCDDGDLADDDACLASCVPAACGDGLLWVGVEACDDGPQNGAYDACAADCNGPGERCGDGEINGAEDCDDADAIDDDDECSDECVTPRLVFTTKSAYYGNLGGLAGADEKCADRALAADLPGTGWRAWLSDGVDSPSSRFDVGFTGHYQLVDGTNVAHGWAGLTSGSLLHPLDLKIPRRCDARSRSVSVSCGMG